MTDPRRNRDLAKIHIGKKQLNMDEPTYRAMLERVAGVSSAKVLSGQQRSEVLEYMRKSGASFEQSKGKRRPHNYDRLPNYVTKVEAMLADMELPWSYADTIARNITGGNGGRGEPGIEKLAWVKKPEHWQAIIAALEVEQKKRGLYQKILEQMEQLGKEETFVIELIEKRKLSSHNWHRKIKIMEGLSLYLGAMIEQQQEDINDD